MIRAEAKRHAHSLEEGQRFMAVDAKDTEEISGSAPSLSLVASEASDTARVEIEPDPTGEAAPSEAPEDVGARIASPGEATAPSDEGVASDPGEDRPEANPAVESPDELQDALLSALEELSSTMQPEPVSNGVHSAAAVRAEANSIQIQTPVTDDVVSREDEGLSTTVPAAGDRSDQNYAPELALVGATASEATMVPASNDDASAREARSGSGTGGPFSAASPDSIAADSPVAAGESPAVLQPSDGPSEAASEPIASETASERRDVKPAEPAYDPPIRSLPASTPPAETARSLAAAPPQDVEGSFAGSTTEGVTAPKEGDILDELVAALDSLHRDYSAPKPDVSSERPRLANRLIALAGPTDNDPPSGSLDDGYDAEVVDIDDDDDEVDQPVDVVRASHQTVPRLPAPSAAKQPAEPTRSTSSPSLPSFAEDRPDPVGEAGYTSTPRRPSSTPGQSIVTVAPPSLPSRTLVAMPAAGRSYGAGAAPVQNTAIGFSAGFALAMALGAALYACLTTF